MHETGTMRVKSGLAEMLKGGVIMDVVDAEQAKIAEAAGACAVMALERVPADIRRDGGVARMSDPDKIKEIQEAVTIPVMAKCRIGHFAEAQILQALEIDYIDESEVLTPADLEHHVDKWEFTVPFVCGCTNLGEALRRIAEGAAMIRTKGEAGTGDIVNAVTHMRSVFGSIRRLQSLRSEELYAEAKNLQAPYELVQWVAEHGRLPVVTFTAGGIATPADASLCMQLGADGVFVGSGIFKSGDPDKRARAIVEATTHYLDASVLAEVSAGLGEAMVGISTASLDTERPARAPRLVAARDRRSLQHDRRDHHEAARERRRRRTLGERKPHPERSQHHFQQRDQCHLGGRDQPCRHREEGEPEPDLRDAEQGDQHQVGPVDLARTAERYEDEKDQRLREADGGCHRDVAPVPRDDDAHRERERHHHRQREPHAVGAARAADHQPNAGQRDQPSPRRSVARSARAGRARRSALPRSARAPA